MDRLATLLALLTTITLVARAADIGQDPMARQIVAVTTSGVLAARVTKRISSVNP